MVQLKMLFEDFAQNGKKVTQSARKTEGGGKG